MKTRITNLLTATLWLLIIAVWLPTFWALAQLPGTWDGDKPSALLNYVKYELGTVYYRIDDPNKSRDCDPNPKSGGNTPNFLTTILFFLLLNLAANP